MLKWSQDPEETHFLNVDLDVWSRSPLDALVAAFGRAVFVHYVGPEDKRYGAHLSVAGGGDDADVLTRKLIRLVMKLPRGARKLWDQAQAREFNVGVQGGVKPHCYEIRIKPETLELVARLRGRMVVTIYAAEVQARQPIKPSGKKSRPPHSRKSGR